MINIYKNNKKIIGVYKTVLDKNKIYLPNIKDYAISLLFTELKKDNESNLFTYQIMSTTITVDLFGLCCEIIFEFVPNKELVEELKIVTERLQVGL